MKAFEDAARKEGYGFIAGIDEAGRGPLAGPVVAAAVILPEDYTNPRITDSKKLTPKTRETLYVDIYQHAITVGIGIVDAPEIDRLNILGATRLAMGMAVGNLSPSADFLLIDGNASLDTFICQQTIVKGDSASISIAAASIVAKITRDRMMEQYNLDFPEFGFSRHKGYPTRAHREAVRKYGPSPIHRKSFQVRL